MEKGTRIGPHGTGSGFFIGIHNTHRFNSSNLKIRSFKPLTKDSNPNERRTFMKKTRMIAYRRRCRRSGAGLSHYIMLTPKTGQKK
jgi:modified peptide precursor CbpA